MHWENFRSDGHYQINLNSGRRVGCFIPPGNEGHGHGSGYCDHQIKIFFVDWGYAAKSGELGRGFTPPVSIHIPARCVSNYPFHWDVEVETFGVILLLEDNTVQHEAFLIGSSKDK